MIFEQFYLKELGHASYLIGSEETGEALIVDPRRDVDTYFAAARRHEMRIAYASDTHQHNDYISGICELPTRGDVHLLASARAELKYRAMPLRDGERLELGEIVFEALHTPGHTPEHMALLVTDRYRDDTPTLLLSGGALLVGDVGRPDLLGDRDTVRRHSADLADTLKHKILSLPDHVRVYPTHVAGSLCGATINSQLATTIGYERRTNPVLACLQQDRDAFERCIDVAALPTVPPYWRRMRHQNQHGPTLLGQVREPIPLSATLFEQRMQGGAVVLDCRSPEAYSVHIPRALNVGVGDKFTTWAGSVLPDNAAVLLVVEDSADVAAITWSLLRIGCDAPVGWLAGGMRAWRTAARPLEMLPLLSVHDLKRDIATARDLLILDVRQPAEWRAGHIRKAWHISGAQLAERAGELPRNKQIAVICSSGYRSGVAASVLKYHGFERVTNIMGGVEAWRKAGYELVREA